MPPTSDPSVMTDHERCALQCSHAEAFSKMRRTDDGNTAVVLSNPKTLDFEICRPALLPGKRQLASERSKERGMVTALFSFCVRAFAYESAVSSVSVHFCAYVWVRSRIQGREQQSITKASKREIQNGAGL